MNDTQKIKKMLTLSREKLEKLQKEYDTLSSENSSLVVNQIADEVLIKKMRVLIDKINLLINLKGKVTFSDTLSCIKTIHDLINPKK